VDREATAPGDSGRQVHAQWTARKVSPGVLLSVILVFAAFIALAELVVHSREAVSGLALAALGALAATVPGVLEKTQYRLTEVGIEKRSLRRDEAGAFTTIFRWDELSHVVPLRRGFKFSKGMDDSNPIRRFCKRHISTRYSGEVHVERADLTRVLALVEQRRAASPDPAP
jgi:hypothetical protein